MSTLASAVARFDTLRRRLTGPVALPGEPLYARLATGFNVAVTAAPAAVVEARNPQDVVETVRFAAATGRAVAVQATGHGIAGGLDGALLVHTGRLTEVAQRYDPARVLRAGQVPVR